MENENIWSVKEKKKEEGKGGKYWRKTESILCAEEKKNRERERRHGWKKEKKENILPIEEMKN